MAVTSFEFFFFFAALLVFWSALRSPTAKKCFLLVASYCYYASWSVPSCLAILFMSLADYRVGKSIGATTDPLRRKHLLLVSIAANLGILALFKYSNFLLENASAIVRVLGLPWAVPHWSISSPPGISYFTFAGLSYVTDVYFRRMTPAASARDYTLFVAFFPKVLAGPITRATEFLPQLTQRFRLNLKDVEAGVCIFMSGAVKKMVISDQVAGSVNLVFAAPQQYDSVSLMAALLGYSVQIYCDFAGYSEMAIGCARILGFQLPDNFRMPYSSASITEFWRRWHITLSGWFRDYVFLPLEIATRSSFKPWIRVSLNTTLTMLLCGLWHGAGWNFVLWGGIHGTALATHKAWTTWDPLHALKRNVWFRRTWSWVSHLITLALVLLGWVFFRTDSFSTACLYLGRMFSFTHDGMRLVSPQVASGVVAVSLVHLLVNKDRDLVRELPEWSMPARILGYTALVSLLVCFGATNSAPFIYFQF